MQLFELVSPRLFRPLAGPNRAFYAELLLLLWEECRHTADYSISRAEAVSRAEDYFAALAKPLTLDADGAGDEEEQPTRDPHTLALGFLLRLRRTGWLEEQPGSYESEPTLAFVPEVAPLLDALEEILNPRVVTYTGKLYKAWQLLQGVGEEKNPYENVLREVASDLEALNKSLRALNASIGHYIDRLTATAPRRRCWSCLTSTKKRWWRRLTIASRPATTCSITAPIWRKGWTPARKRICPNWHWITPVWSAAPPVRPRPVCAPSSSSSGTRWKR